ncbi:metallophosphoesterase [Sphingopyxis alaskensis RB2256]|uniref:Metallophosphoesterase n=2 Tax=Sphingopyxis alaskensis TaxID=117207 RepID=Q1GX46_SPHAL|nr:metallophosphoesterase [Sphingopyxis alaskensis RB2256]
MTGTFTFVHAADVHLDSPLGGLAKRDKAFSGLALNATRRALANVVDLAIAEGAAFVVVAGDLYDGTWKDQSTGQFAVSQFARLSRAGIRVAIAFGNHDAESRITRHLTMPEGVFGFSNRKCETVLFEDLGVALHGRSYKDVATLENIAAEYCPPVTGMFNLAVLHTALEGHPDHARYAPCSVGELVASGHDYWALGHVHDASIRSEHPHIVYPGNTQGRNVRETGVKGAMVVRVEEGVVRSVEHRACDEVRWARPEFDGRQASDMHELLSGIGGVLQEAIAGAGDRPTAVRLHVKTSGGLQNKLLADPDWFNAEVGARAMTVSESLWIERVKVESSEDAATRGLPPELIELLNGALADPDCLRAVEDAVAPLVGKMPAGTIDADLAPLLAAASARDGNSLLAAAKRAVEASLSVDA